ncbi:tetratricopeptide repeat protein [Streptomyces jumonjinensis]|uniref:Tat pathway signal protein n=1 Tax=Streptomyces jumonjinensis TaxID=1945 RepID=A0A646KCF8_STRJU|nr:hypothetical protein [Streptomyces jumonjinensis]MQS99893.1 hypothetical protein [Streptomyces jumonjinensis]
MADNVHLAVHMEATGLKQAELAQRLNDRIEGLTGRPGNLTDRHIRNWLTGKTRWPQKRQRVALEAEFQVSALELGFVPRSGARGGELSSSAIASPPSEDPVKRRTFAGATLSLTTAALVSVPNAAARPRVGMRDVNGLEAAFAELVVADNAHGGTIKLETRALAFARHALERQAIGTTTERVRSRLYYLAAAFTGTALWAAVDDFRPDRAHRHLQQALMLAGLSGNSEIQLRLWSHASLLASQQPGRIHEAIAAAQTARNASACRRDPLYASLTSARLAGVQAQAGDTIATTAALRAMDQARVAFDRADPATPRPAWIDFYDRAELHGLSALIMARVGRHSEAEAHFHQTLARLRPQYRRNRTYYTTHLALTQLRQGDVEEACATALSVLATSTGDSLTGRTGRCLARFNRELVAKARGAKCISEWTARYTERQERRQ